MNNGLDSEREEGIAGVWKAIALTADKRTRRPSLVRRPFAGDVARSLRWYGHGAVAE